MHTAKELEEALAGLLVYSSWKRWRDGKKNIHTGMESYPIHQGQEAPERYTSARWWMPFGIIIVGEHH